MVRALFLASWLAALSLASATAAPVTFDFASIGNAGNAPDPQTGLGAVATTYAISKTEVTNSQYTEFLNAVDPIGSDVHGLYNPRMASYFSGIEKTGTADGARYVAQAGREQKPVTFVSFFDAMRFVNWLHNGQGSGDTETGVYAISNGIDEVRSPNAKFWIPSEDEWYKAAYHDATAGTAGIYFDYATGSNEEPISDSPEDNPAAVNYYNDDGILDGVNDGYAVFNDSPNPSTDVGAYTAAASPYGTFDQNGNVWEWNDTLFVSAYRGDRGGGWSSGPKFINSTDTGYNDPAFENGLGGFRIAAIPEPSSVCLGLVASFILMGSLRRSGAGQNSRMPSESMR